MKTNHYTYILKDIALFNQLPAKDIAYIRKNSSFVEYKKGQVIYKEGAVPSGFHVLISGRVMIYTQDRYGKQNVLEYLHRGKYFGIISALTGEPHSVSAKAINDCLMLEIPRAAFEAVLKRVPQIAIEVSKTLSRRLRHKDTHAKKIFETTIIAVLSAYPDVGKTVYASNLAFSLSKEAHKSVVILDIAAPDKIHRMPDILGTRDNYKVFNLSSRLLGVEQVKDFIYKDKFGVDIVYMSYANNTDFWPKSVVEIVSLLVNEYHYIILDLPSCHEEPILTILNQADIIHILASPVVRHLRGTARLTGRLQEDFQFPPSKVKVVVNQGKVYAKMKTEEQVRLLKQPVFASLPSIEGPVSGRAVLEKPDSPYAKVLRRISRQEGDCLTGLALGVGLAYGFCHIGVLKVLEEEKIPIDIVSGASIGSVFASMWALGWSSQEILRITKEFGEPKNVLHLLDFTFPMLGLLKGNKLYAFLKHYLGNKTFYDVKIPLRIVASDVKRRETKIFDKGPLVEAIMASCAMPGIFAPFKIKGELLFDGGVLNPLPTQPLFEMGVNRIIAVNVTPSREDAKRQFEAGALKSKLSGKPGFDWKRILQEKLKSNVLDYIFSSFEVMQSEVAQAQGKLADVVLHPDMSGLHWLEVHRCEEFAKRGEEEARKHLDKIKQLVCS